jgi:hypothetical protein
MRHLVLTIVAIALAGIAAVAATTAMLNVPLRIGPAAGSTPTPAQPGQTQAPASKEIPDAPPPKGAEPQPATPGSTEPASAEPAGAKPPAEGETPESPYEDPYEGIAPEDLPPDLQYDADASVSFPTNT